MRNFCADNHQPVTKLNSTKEFIMKFKIAVSSQSIPIKSELLFKVLS